MNYKKSLEDLCDYVNYHHNKKLTLHYEEGKEKGLTILKLKSDEKTILRTVVMAEEFVFITKNAVYQKMLGYIFSKGIEGIIKDMSGAEVKPTKYY